MTRMQQYSKTPASIISTKGTHQPQLQPESPMCTWRISWIEIPCLYTTQVIEHIDCLLHHGGTETFTGQLLDGTLETAKVELGISGQLLTNSFDLYGHLLTDSWIKGVWHEVWENKITVQEKTKSLFLKKKG